jgi:acetyltransferase-like isoleucine patch superfamily enzyme
MRLYKFFGACLLYLYNVIVTHIPLYSFRHLYLRILFGIGIGKGSSVHMGCFITGRRTSIGTNTVINRNCHLDGRGGLRVGDNVNVSPEVYFISLTHDFNSPTFPPLPREIVVENNVWIGARAIIMPGVRLQEGCVVGAGAVVTRDVASYCIVAGVPARKIGERIHEIRYKASYFPYFNTDIDPHSS